MSTAIRVLVIDDDPTDRAAVRRALSGTDVFIAEAETLADALAQIGAGALDAIVADYLLPDGNAGDLLRALRRREADVPVVVITGHGDERIAVDLMKSGAADYLAKHDATPRRLRRVLRAAVRIARAEQLARAAEREKERLIGELDRERERLSRALAERDEVLAIVSHDLRSPLASIAMALEDLAIGDHADRAQVVAISQRALARMTRLIEDLLDVSRIEKGALSLEVSDHDAAQLALDAIETVRLAAQRERISLLPEIAPDLGIVRADRARIAQVLQNLLSNALKFTPGGGTIRVRASAAEDVVRYEVHDDGPGVPAHVRAHVFERFFQARRGDRTGAGLGLAIVKGIVEAHGGRVGLLDSERGARFAFDLPKADRVA